MNPTPEEVCMFLEGWAAELECEWISRKEARRFLSAVYKFCHIARNPSCLPVHKDWIAEWDAIPKEIKGSKES